MLCAACPAAWGREDGKFHSLFFRLLVFLSDCVDEYVGTVFKGHPKAAEGRAPPGQHEGGSKVANVIRCQGAGCAKTCTSPWPVTSRTRPLCQHCPWAALCCSSGVT